MPNLKNYQIFSTIFLFFLLNSNTLQSEEKFINVLAFGDWGTGTSKQREVAESMKRVCTELRCDFGLLLGDNFYDNGVDDVNDRQFKSKFELPYSPLKIPFYAVLGNHDDRGDTRSQVEYTQRSTWWNMPSTYYKKRIGNILLVGINSNDFDSKQERFVKKALSESDAKWKVVFGHHPIRSYGSHGDTGHLVDHLLPTLCENNAMYFAGHDHDLQVLQSDCGTPLIISGAAAKLRSTKKGSKTLFAKSTYGYSIMSFGEKTAKLSLYNKKDKIIYENTYSSSTDEKASVYLKEIGKDGNARCNPNEVMHGVTYKSSGDDHITGIYCLRSEKNKSRDDIEYSVNSAHLPDSNYDISCEDYDYAVTGVNIHKDKDTYLKNFICQPRLGWEEKYLRYYIEVDQLFGTNEEAKCSSTEHAVVGFKFEDIFDHHIDGIYCH